MPPRASRKALAFIFVTALLDSTGLGIVIPVTPELIMELSGEGLSQAATYGGWLMFVYALMQFLWAPVVGNLGDAFGRRPVLLFSLGAFAVDYCVMGFAPNLMWLFIGRMLAGVAGATFPTCNAYIADVSPPEERAANFGLIGAAFGLGFMLGPVIGGLLGEYGPRVPFFAAACVALLNMVYGIFVLPESLPRERRRPFTVRRANPWGALLQMRVHKLVFALLGAQFLFQVAHDANPAAWSYYTMKKFDWSEREIGYSLGAIGLVMSVVQGGLIRAIIPRLGERRAAFAGLALMTFGFFGFAFATDGWMMYAFIVPFCIGSVASPALRGIMSGSVPSDQQGELQGAVASLVGFTAILAPPLMTQLFGIFSADAAPVYFPGAPFLAAGLCLLGSMVLMRRAISRFGAGDSG